MPKHFSEEEKETIRNELLAVGLEQFEHFGFNKTNVDDITAKVGIAKGSFYNFFSSKGDLFLEIYSLERQKVQKKAVSTLKNNVKDDIDVLIKKYFDILYNARKKRPILNIVYESDVFSAITNRQVRQRLNEFNEIINEQMSEMIQGWLDDRGKYSIDARTITSMMRSVNLLQYHEVAIGGDLYEKTIYTLIDAVAQLVKRSIIVE